MKKEAKKLLNFQSIYGSAQYTKTVFIAWKVTINEIKQKRYGHKAINILEIMAYLAPDSILLETIFSKQINKKELWIAINILIQYSMINLKENTSNIHRLVQVIRLSLQEQNQEEDILYKTLELLNSTKITEENYSHIMSIWDYASKYGKIIDKIDFDSKYNYIKKYSIAFICTK